MVPNDKKMHHPLSTLTNGTQVTNCIRKIRTLLTTQKPYSSAILFSSYSLSPRFGGGVSATMTLSDVSEGQLSLGLLISAGAGLWEKRGIL